MKKPLQHFLETFSPGKDLTAREAVEFFEALQTEIEDENLIAAALTAFEAKGATIDEIFAMAKLMRGRAVKVSSKHKIFVDVVGTGGSKAKTFNVSTAAAFVVAGSGLPVAKHGNRAATSKSGSADVLAVLGVNPAVDASKAEKCLNEIDICFMFAPKFHALSPVLGKVRRSLGIPTIFNNLGPLSNPAGAPHQVIGVWKPDLVEKTAHVLARLGTERSWVVHGSDGLDEVSLYGETSVAEITGDEVEFFQISPADFGIKNSAQGSFPKCSAEESARIILEVFSGRERHENARNLILINAAAAIYVAGRETNLRHAVESARASLDDGKALEKLQNLIEFTNNE
jgi:anthranilate phosphoribosyltransferase